MKTKSTQNLTGIIIAALSATLSAVGAGNTPGGFTTEPDKTMAAAHESFVKKDMNKAAEQVHKAAATVKKESESVAAGAKDGMRKAGAELDELGDSVKNGTVKSEAELKKTFAKVDHQIADCWHKTAAESKKSGKDSTADLAKAGTSLENSAKWSGNKLKEGTQSSVDAIKKAGKATGQGIKTGAEEVGKWFQNLGDGISDLGKKL